MGSRGGMEVIPEQMAIGLGANGSSRAAVAGRGQVTEVAIVCGLHIKSADIEPH